MLASACRENDTEVSRFVDFYGDLAWIQVAELSCASLAHFPATLILHGAADKIVAPRSTELLAARLSACGTPIERTVYPRVGHAWMFDRNDEAIATWDRAQSEAIQFLLRH